MPIRIRESYTNDWYNYSQIFELERIRDNSSFVLEYEQVVFCVFPKFNINILLNENV